MKSKAQLAQAEAKQNGGLSAQEIEAKTRCLRLYASNR